MGFPMRLRCSGAFAIWTVYLLVLLRSALAENAGCPTTKVTTVPGCWGVPGCAHVIATRLGPGAACKYDYCNCGGTNVPLLPSMIDGVSKMGCGSYTVQPTADNCPTGPTGSSLHTSGDAKYLTSRPAGTMELQTRVSSRRPHPTGPRITSDKIIISHAGATSIARAISSSRILPLSVRSQHNASLWRSSYATHSSSSTGGQISDVDYTSGQTSLLNAFDATEPSDKTLMDDSETVVWHKTTLSSLMSITAATTITADVVLVAPSSSATTTAAAAIVVGPGGVWWTGGGGRGGDERGGHCIWPFCHVGINGGGGSGGSACFWPFCSAGRGLKCIWPFCGGSGRVDSGSGESNNGVQNTKSDPRLTEPEASKPATLTTTVSWSTGSITSSSEASFTSSSSLRTSISCTQVTTVSDCSVACSKLTTKSAYSCATRCYSTLSGCDITGITTTTVASSTCTGLQGWLSIGPEISDRTLDLSASGSAGSSTRGSSSSVATTISKDVVVPTCTADGASWYSPATWCNCGSTAKYSTLQAVSGATIANCAYTSLPAVTIVPMQTTKAPTNVPGQAGIGACKAMVARPGTSQYCMCNGTPAPTLEPTMSGIMNCAYTVLPTSSWNPAIPSLLTSTTKDMITSSHSPSSTKQPQPAANCNVHVFEAHGTYPGDPQVALIVSITDGSGKNVGQHSAGINWGRTVQVEGNLPYQMAITPNIASKSRLRFKRLGSPVHPWPQNRDSTLTFTYGDSTWRQSDARCKVGSWDAGNFADFVASFAGFKFLLNRQMDCSFSCSPGHALRRHEPRDISNRTQNSLIADISLLTSRGVPPRSEIFKTTARKGFDLYKAWQQSPMVDNKDLCQLGEDYSELPEQVSIYRPIDFTRSMLLAAGADVAQPFYRMFVGGPGRAGEDVSRVATFSNNASPAAGIFIACSNDRGDPRCVENFSDIAWYQWVRTVRAANPQATDFSTMKYVLRDSISNEGTKNILREAMYGQNQEFIEQPAVFSPFKRGSDGLLTQELDDDLDQNPFWAMLGSSNGRGIGFMMRDYKLSMKGKGVQSLSAQLANGRIWYMLATIG